MLGRFMPREGKFFDLFNAHAQQIVLGAETLDAMMRALDDSPEQVRAYADEIDVIEDRADKITHQTVALLHSTFITPLDRDEIHRLISRLDDVLDTIQDAAQMVSTYNLRSSTVEAVQFSKIILACAVKIADAVKLLSDLDNGPKILLATREIGTLEADADLVLRDALSKIFREEPDVRQLIKLKGLYESLETVTDHCDDVGNMLEAIVVENS